MGWTDSHLHQFEKDGKVWGDPRNDEFGEFNIIDEGGTPLNKALKLEGDSMVYVYDFGDDWRHEVLLEKIASVEGTTNRPVCLGGERRCTRRRGRRIWLLRIPGCHLRPRSQRLRPVHPLGRWSLPGRRVRCESGKRTALTDALADTTQALKVYRKRLAWLHPEP
jgi:hypothetical protein